MKKDNRGATLIELVICLVIFAVVVTSAFGFLLTSVHSYNTITDRLNLELQSRLTMNQLGEYIIDCNACLYYSKDTLYSINEKPDGTYTAHVFEYKADGCIYYGEGDAVQAESGKFNCIAEATDLLAENVTSFSVTPISADGTRVTAAKVSIVFVNRSATSRGEKTIALRNKPAIGVVQTG